METTLPAHLTMPLHMVNSLPHLAADAKAQPYPPAWPAPNPLKPRTLHSRISEEDKKDLYNRRVTTRALAKKYGVTEKWLSYVFPGKRPVEHKTFKRKARMAFREFLARQVVAKERNIYAAAAAACTSYSTMRRIVLRVTGAQRLTPLPRSQK